MPFARIHLLAGRPAAWIDAISASLQQALEEEFEVPAHDQFQAFHQHQPGELRFDRNYMGGPRSDHFVLIHLFTGRTRSAETRQRFLNKLVTLLADKPGIEPHDVMITISNGEMADWSFANGVAATWRAES